MEILKENMRAKGIYNIIDSYDWFKNKTNYKPYNYNMLNDTLTFINIDCMDCINILNLVNEILQKEINTIYFYGGKLIISLNF